MRCLAALRGRVGPDGRPVVERLLERLTALAAETGTRRDAFDALDWPETLLHGDLWLGNCVVTEAGGAHLIDYSLHFDPSEVTAVSGFIHRCDDTAPDEIADHGTLRIWKASGATTNITVSRRDFEGNACRYGYVSCRRWDGCCGHSGYTQWRDSRRHIRSCGGDPCGRRSFGGGTGCYGK